MITLDDETRKKLDDYGIAHGLSRSAVIRLLTRSFFKGGNANMNLLQYKSAEDFLAKTGLSIEQALSLLENELQRLQKKVDNKNQN